MDNQKSFKKSFFRKKEEIFANIKRRVTNIKYLSQNLKEYLVFQNKKLNRNREVFKAQDPESLNRQEKLIEFIITKGLTHIDL